MSNAESGYSLGYVENLQAELTAALAEIDRLREALETALIENDGAEINPSNYRHDNVCDLNSHYIGLFMAIEQALAPQEMK